LPAIGKQALKRFNPGPVESQNGQQRRFTLTRLQQVHGLACEVVGDHHRYPRDDRVRAALAPEHAGFNSVAHAYQGVILD
jgi:hypothetical protein